MNDIFLCADFNITCKRHCVIIVKSFKVDDQVEDN